MEEKGFDFVEVLFCVYAYGVCGGFGYVDVDVVFEQAELLEAFDLFERRGWERGEALESGAAVGVEAKVLPAGCAEHVTVVRDGGAGEVERVAVWGGDYFDYVGVGEAGVRAADFERGYGDFGAGEGVEQGFDVAGLEEWFVGLDVDVDVGRDLASYGKEAVAAAGEIGRGHQAAPVARGTELGDLFGVGRDDDFVELRAAEGGFNNPGQERLAAEIAEDLARQARGGEARGDDSEDARVWVVHRCSGWSARFFR